MLFRSLFVTLAVAAASAIVRPSAAQDGAPSYPAAPLLSTGTSIVGEPIHYPTGDAHITASVITLAPGARTILHKHGVPLFAYILAGELTVNYGEHGTRTYQQGQAFMEAMEVAHYGINTGAQPVRILAVYMGAAGAQDVIPVK